MFDVLQYLALQYRKHHALHNLRLHGTSLTYLHGSSRIVIRQPCNISNHPKNTTLSFSVPPHNAATDSSSTPSPSPRNPPKASPLYFPQPFSHLVVLLHPRNPPAQSQISEFADRERTWRTLDSGQRDSARWDRRGLDARVSFAFELVGKKHMATVRAKA